MLYPQQTATRTLEDLSGMWKFRAETEPIDATKPLSDFVWMAVQKRRRTAQVQKCM